MTDLERIKTKLKRWAIAESDGHPYASIRVDYYEALLKRATARGEACRGEVAERERREG